MRTITSDNYIMHVLLQSDTAGHYHAIGDEVNMAPKDRSCEELPNCRDLTKIHH